MPISDLTSPEEGLNEESSNSIDVEVNVDWSDLEEGLQRLEEVLVSFNTELTKAVDKIEQFVNKCNDLIKLEEEAEQSNTVGQRHRHPVVDGYKTCNCCKLSKPVSDFQVVNHTNKGTAIYKAVCKQCTKNVSFVARYGFSAALKPTTLRRLILAYNYFCNCRERGGRLDYAGWSVLGFLNRLSGMKIVAYSTVNGVFKEYYAGGEYLGRLPEGMLSSIEED